MEIKFENVIPVFMRDLEISEHSLWRSNKVFHSSEKVLINAVSGKGKTSLTYLLCGLLQNYEGRIFFDEKNINSVSLKQWTDIRKTKLSFIFQDLQLFSHLTVRENFDIVWKLNDENHESRAMDYCSQLKIIDKWNSPCKNLSMGQKQRVAIVRALCRPFEFLVMDEPFSHLDIDNSVNAFKIIEERVNELKAGFILTTLDDVDSIKFDTQYYL